MFVRELGNLVIWERGSVFVRKDSVFVCVCVCIEGFLPIVSRLRRTGGMKSVSVWRGGETGTGPKGSSVTWLKVTRSSWFRLSSEEVAAGGVEADEEVMGFGT